MNQAIKDTLIAPVYDVANITPLKKATKLSRKHACEIYFKREDLQPIHSFKIRGAYTKIASLGEDAKKLGIIAASAGNHAQGVALSAQKCGVDAVIVMPVTTPTIKVEAVKSLGANVILHGDSYSDAFEHSQKIARVQKRIFIHPFDDPLVIAGQGTIGKELLEQLPNINYVFIPIGGGGLAAGVGQYIKSINKNIQIIGVEPEDSNAMQQSIKNNKRVKLSSVGIFADGVAVKQVGVHTLKKCRKYVDDFITVSTDDICAAIKFFYEDTRAIAEPAGALSIAGIEKYFTTHTPFPDAHIVALCTGANMAFERLQFVSERTLIGSKKEVLLAVSLPEEPGALYNFCKNVINDNNIREFGYRHNKTKTGNVFVGIAVNNDEQRGLLLKRLKRNETSFKELTDDNTFKEHIRYMIGGKKPTQQSEVILEVIFPERAGALMSFLEIISDRWNISLFHYRFSSTNSASVLIGFECNEPEKLNALLNDNGITFKQVSSKGIDLFL